MNPTEPIAVTTGYYGGQATVKALDESIVLPVGLALYPQPAQQGMAYAALMQSASDWICEHVPTGTRGATAWATKLQDAAHALRASHWQAPAQAAAPAQAGEYPALVCDYCGALTPDPWHSSGMLHGKMSKHIHSCDACCRGAAQAAPQQEAQAAERRYINGVKTVADLVNNLLLLDQSLPIYAAQHIQIANRRRTITVPPTVSRERVKDERWIGEGDELNAAVIWTRAEEAPQPSPAAQEDVPESEYRRGYRHGYEQRDAEVRGALV